MGSCERNNERTLAVDASAQIEKLHPFGSFFLHVWNLLRIPRVEFFLLLVRHFFILGRRCVAVAIPPPCVVDSQEVRYGNPNGSQDRCRPIHHSNGVVDRRSHVRARTCSRPPPCRIKSERISGRLENVPDAAGRYLRPSCSGSMGRLCYGVTLLHLPNVDSREPWRCSRCFVLLSI